ncbi:MAG TPA: glycosyltransferase [Candidatus Saccharibacteria bacterium]|nr:glycosyltransferase [Candidatus Saccharibacteria bacterium]
MKVAIVHDWFLEGGAEKVVLELHHMYPEAPIYTSYCSPAWREKLDNTVITGYLQHWPFSKLRKFIPLLRQHWFENLDFSDYDLVISSSGAEAKGIKVPKSVMHINYCHAPTHYYWNRYYEYIKSPGFGVFNPLARLGLKVLLNPIRKWDLKAAQRPDYMIANSTFTCNQIKKYYHRDSTVIHPPVEIGKFLLSANGSQLSARNGFIITGRHVPYKRFDLAIEACNQLQLPLKVLGTGPETKKLKRLAGPTIDFKGYVSDQEIVTLLQSAEAFIFPGLDDFGIAPVAAMAAGTPVIAYKDGGSLDYIVEGKTGLFFNKQTSSSLETALQNFKKHIFNSEHIKNEAKEYDPVIFRQKMHDYIAKARRS